MGTRIESDLLTRLASGYALPALSLIAVRLVDLASDETCSVRDLSRLIEKDPSLATRLIRLANSAFFRTVQPATTLNQAIVKIGLHQLRIMALSLSLRDTFPMGRVGSFDYEKFWRASLYRALLARSLSQRQKICNPEEAFTAGLILEIGLLIFFDFFVKEGKAEINLDMDTLEELLAWQRATYGLDHRKMGEVALAYWKFPDRIVECQGLYGDRAVHGSSPPLVRVCEMAREISNSLFYRSAGFDAPFLSAKKFFGLDGAVVNDILLSAFEQVEEIAEGLRIEVDKERDLLALMEKANRALGHISEKISNLGSPTTQGPLPSFETLLQGGEKAACVTHTLEAVAHEIKNPLVAIAGFAKRLSKALDPCSDGGKYARIILEESLRLEKALSKMTP